MAVSTCGRKNRSSPIVSPDIRSNRTNRNSIHCTSLGKRSADMWRKMSLARVELVRGSGPVHLNRQTVEIGIEKAFDQGRLLNFVFCRVVFAKRILPQIIGISSETGRRCRYARRFMPDSVKVEIQIVVCNVSARYYQGNGYRPLLFNPFISGI